MKTYVLAGGDDWIYEYSLEGLLIFWHNILVDHPDLESHVAIEAVNFGSDPNPFQSTTMIPITFINSLTGYKKKLCNGDTIAFDGNDFIIV